MGVKGLSTFFDLNPDLSTPHKLYDGKIVIDGNNLVYTLYLANKIDCLYGGDYDKYASVVRKFFSDLLSCNIEPHVVFDGGYEASGKKLNTVRIRSKDRLLSAKSIAKSCSCSKNFLPLLAQDVLKSVATQMGIRQTQCDFEADEHIAALANSLRCPVVSQDSDFYVFNLCGGFVSFGSIDSSVSREEVDGRTINFLHCSVYNVDNFLAFFPGFDRASLPLVGTLMGNDYVEISTFSNFFANISLPKAKTKKLKVSKRHVRLIGLLSWLQDRTAAEALEQVLSRLKKKDRDVVRELVSRNVDNYKCVVSEESLLSGDSSLQMYNGKCFPSWLLKELRLAKHSSLLVNATVIRKVFLQVQVEIMGNVSSHGCSLFLRQVIYGILTIHERDSTEKQNFTVNECDRISDSLRWNTVEPILDVPGYGPMPNLMKIPDMDTADKKRFLTTVLGCKNNSLEDFPKSQQLLVASFLFAQKNAFPRMNDEFICAFVFCMIVLPVVNGSGEDISQSDDATVERVSSEENEELMQKIGKYFSKPQHSNARKFQLDIIHCYGQVQSCFLFSKCLNSLLRYPFENPRTELCFNGTFIYNFTVELKRRKIHRQYASQLLADGSSLSKIYQLAIDKICKLEE